MPADNESGEGAFGLGQEMADAVAREQSHRTAWSGGSSPLSDLRYQSGEGDLLRLRPAAADAAIELVLEEAISSDEAQLAELRGALTTDDFYTLITFTRRSIVRALRGETPALIGRALVGLMLVDPERLDARDISWAMALAAWAIERLGSSREDLLRDARRVGPAAAIDALTQFLDQKLDLRDWGFVEVSTPSGAGLAECGLAMYEPTIDLVEVAFRIADAIEEDRYEPASLTLASDLPMVWFRDADRQRTQDSIARVRATISIRSQPRPEAHEHPSTQMLLMFVSECASGVDAEWLARSASDAAGESHHSAVARRGRLVATLIARSVVTGVTSVETAESITRFERALGASLDAVSMSDEHSTARVDERWRPWRRRGHK